MLQPLDFELLKLMHNLELVELRFECFVCIRVGVDDGNHLVLGGRDVDRLECIDSDAGGVYRVLL